MAKVGVKKNDLIVAINGMEEQGDKLFQSQVFTADLVNENEFKCRLNLSY